MVNRSVACRDAYVHLPAAVFVGCMHSLRNNHAAVRYGVACPSPNFTGVYFLLGVYLFYRVTVVTQTGGWEVWDQVHTRRPRCLRPALSA